jgi:predicted tellurium resistance membrane protein TerC
MSDWTLGSFLFWLTAAIFVPAVIIHFALGRKGGHHLYDKFSETEIKNLPFDMLKKRMAWELKGSSSVIFGLVLAFALYSLGGLFGISGEKLIVYTAAAIALLIIFGSAFYRK